MSASDDLHDLLRQRRDAEATRDAALRPLEKELDNIRARYWARIEPLLIREGALRATLQELAITSPTIGDRITYAIEDWAGWTWPHDAAQCECDGGDGGDGGRRVTTGPGSQDDWHDWEHSRAAELRELHTPLCADVTASTERELGERCQRDAGRAHYLGRLALEDVRSGHWQSALSLVTSAASLEREYGDAPAWGPVVRELETLVGAAGPHAGEQMSHHIGGRQPRVPRAPARRNK